MKILGEFIIQFWATPNSSGFVSKYILNLTTCCPKPLCNLWFSMCRTGSPRFKTKIIGVRSPHWGLSAKENHRHRTVVLESLLAPLIVWSPECASSCPEKRMLHWSCGPQSVHCTHCASSYLEKLKLHWFCRKSLSTHQSTSAWVGRQNSPERDFAM